MMPAWETPTMQRTPEQDYMFERPVTVSYGDGSISAEVTRELAQRLARLATSLCVCSVTHKPATRRAAPAYYPSC